MNRNILIRGLAIAIFIIGFILLTLTSWWLFTVAGESPPDEYSLWDWERYRKGGLIWGGMVTCWSYLNINRCDS